VGLAGKEDCVERVTGFIEEASPKRERVIRALDECYDPCCRDRKISVVDMGLIESIEIQGGNVSIEMVLTSGWCPFAARLLEMIKGRIRSGACALSRQDVDPGEGCQEFMGAVCYQRFGCPDLGVPASRFELLSRTLGPLGRRRFVRQLQGH
jgi:metal-sulfur cluster biosynthetic enzyme